VLWSFTVGSLPSLSRGRNLGSECVVSERYGPPKAVRYVLLLGLGVAGQEDAGHTVAQEDGNESSLRFVSMLFECSPEVVAAVLLRTG
jgi:hypothetical protein